MGVVETEQRDAVLIIRFNRPPMNAITLEACEAAAQTLHDSP